MQVSLEGDGSLFEGKFQPETEHDAQQKHHCEKKRGRFRVKQHPRTRQECEKNAGFSPQEKKHLGIDYQSHNKKNSSHTVQYETNPPGLKAPGGIIPWGS